MEWQGLRIPTSGASNFTERAFEASAGGTSDYGRVVDFSDSESHILALALLLS